MMLATTGVFSSDSWHASYERGIHALRQNTGNRKLIKLEDENIKLKFIFLVISASSV